ncbi:glycosyltransferase family 2 protein [Colwellia sp. 1_MG-2023]|uniref:glycosyltransferase family 2 protein n=1 Tax=Colwellia sp. 1_MG-2023 TaxID=3062649 RepID=UPI0026E460D8|nr:glycosyltransferase family 2 protein [Colwellia sp. 1_MG-2023]MDO6444981.1 glycosyltransferase family 2 protein [Colwellia sp. 1_MG-2023]
MIEVDNNKSPTNFKYGISIIIPVYNAENFIVETINSIINQSFNDYEIIFIDDCSTDGSKAKIAPYLTDNIHYFCEEQNTGGPSKPRNTGIKKSQGKYIMFFDSDDLMLPNKLVETFNALEENKYAGLLCTNFQSIDKDSNIISSDFLSEYQSFRGGLVPLKGNLFSLKSNFAYSSLLKANFIGTSSVTIPKTVLDGLNGFDETLTNGDDLDMWYQITHKLDILFISHPLHQYRIQPNSISFRGGVKNSLNRIVVLKKQLALVQSKSNVLQINKRLAKNFNEAGMVEFRNYQMDSARKYFIQSIRYRFNFIAVKYYFASFLNKALINFFKKFKC